jgi:intracellular multiplication protein IcmL
MSSNEITPDVGGDSREAARIHAILSDRDASAHAATLRENTRLQDDNIYLKRQNLRVWATAGVLSTALVMGVGAVFWWFPKYRYIPTKDNRAICEVTSTSSAPVSPAILEDFAKNAVIDSYSYDYVNYRDAINRSTSKWYNDRGRKAFLKSLDDSGNIERVVKGRLIMKAFATNAPQLESEGTEGQHRFWTVQVPVAIEFYMGGGAAPTSTQDFIAEVRIIQEQASALRPSGHGVDSVTLRPANRRK